MSLLKVEIILARKKREGGISFHPKLGDHTYPHCDGFRHAAHSSSTQVLSAKHRGDHELLPTVQMYSALASSRGGQVTDRTTVSHRATQSRL